LLLVAGLTLLFLFFHTVWRHAHVGVTLLSLVSCTEGLGVYMLSRCGCHVPWCGMLTCGAGGGARHSQGDSILALISLLPSLVAHTVKW
jgi:hypothetical protein